MKGISKRFGGVRALDKVDFHLREGTVHALMGENGAGKSTLMKILLGLYQPDEGKIIYQGKEIVLKGPQHALDMGFAMVSQELTQMEEMTVADNIFMGRFPGKLAVNRKEIYQKTRTLFEDLGIKGIQPGERVKALSQAKKQFDVNFFGCFVCCKAVCKYMRKNGGGKIINISSMAAPLSIPFQAFYSASKSAVNSLTLALANELRPFNISVCAFMPGDVKTAFTAQREKQESGAEVYGETIKKSLEQMEKDEQNGMSPEKIADAVCLLAKRKHPKPLSTTGINYKCFAVLSKILPMSAVNRIVGIIYS